MIVNLQDAFLAQIKKEGAVVSLYLVNGFQLKGTVKGFDNFTIVLENMEGRHHLIYKHAVTTINPLKSMSTDFLTEAFAAAKESSD